MKHPRSVLCRAKRQAELFVPSVARVRNGLLVPYVEIEIPLDCIKTVIVGPTLYPQLQSEALRVLFRKTGVKDIRIEESEIPFRRL